MDPVKVLSDGSSRQRSILPQRAGSKPSSTRLDSLGEQEDIAAGKQSTALQKPQATTVTDGSQDETKSMPPPAKLGRSRSVRKSAKDGAVRSQPAPSVMRKPSAGKPPSQDLFVTPARAIVKSNISINTTTSKTSFHGRSVSQQLRPTATPSGSSLRTPSFRQSLMKTQRPAFSVMQQQFTPKKSNKSRPTSPSSQSTNKDEIPSADVFHLQMELAQLHLLHRSAAPVQAQWEQSARESFQHRFDALCERHVELKEIAHQQQTLINQIALVQWSQSRSGAQIAEKVQLLSRNVSDVCNLLDAEGKYTRILEIFESWFTQALDIRGQREAKTTKAERGLSFNEGIGDGWKAETMVLERELTYCLRDLKGFGNVRQTSSLGRILSLYGKMVVSLLEELDIIQWIENEIMVQETSWVESTIHKLASNVSDDIGSMASTEATTQR